MNKILIIARWMLMLLITGSALLAIWSGIQLWQQAQIRAYINDPAAYDTVPEHPRAHFAKAAQLVHEQKNALALEQLTLVLGSHDPDLMPITYFNRGNINLREALSMTASDARQIPLIELAKQDFRSALALAPDMWDARYNLELALRVVPEDPDINPDFDKNIISSQRSIESKAFKVDLP